MLEQHILVAFIHRFPQQGMLLLLSSKEKDKGILVKHYFHITSICRIGVELFKFRPWFGSFVFKGKKKVNPCFSCFCI